MNFSVKPILTDTLRRTRRLQRRIPVVTAQELNRQGRRSRTLITRQLSTASGVKPQKRIRRRVLLPRRGNAKPRRLRKDGLTLFESFPGRYFPKGIPPGARVRVEPEGQVDRRGRRTKGQPFRAKMPSGHRGLFRRLGTASLPIRNVETVSLEGPGYAIRQKVLIELAAEFPSKWESRMRRETRRVFGR